MPYTKQLPSFRSNGQRSTESETIAVDVTATVSTKVPHPRSARTCPQVSADPSNSVGGLPVLWTSSGMKHSVHALCHGENASSEDLCGRKDEKHRGTYLFQLNTSGGQPARGGRYVKVWWTKLIALRRNRVSPVADARAVLQFRRHDRESTKHTE